MQGYGLHKRREGEELARGLSTSYIKSSCGTVQKFQEHANEYPWTWSAHHVDEFLADRRSSEKGLALSTLRANSGAIRAPAAKSSHPAGRKRTTHPAPPTTSPPTKPITYRGYPATRNGEVRLQATEPPHYRARHQASTSALGAGTTTLLALSRSPARQSSLATIPSRLLCNADNGDSVKLRRRV